MKNTDKVIAGDFVIGLDRDFLATPLHDASGHDTPFDGLAFGVVGMTRNAPHNGERHPDGDEVLHLVSGRARVVFTDDPLPDVEIGAGETVVVPRGLWHRVDILEPCRIVYLTPSRGNEVRPLD